MQRSEIYKAWFVDGQIFCSGRHQSDNRGNKSTNRFTFTMKSITRDMVFGLERGLWRIARTQIFGDPDRMTIIIKHDLNITPKILILPDNIGRSLDIQVKTKVL